MTPDDLGVLLERASQGPAGALDLERLAREVNRARRRNHALGGMVIGMVIAAVGVLTVTVTSIRADRIEFAGDPRDGSVPTPSDLQPGVATDPSGLVLAIGRADHAEVVVGEPLHLTFTNKGTAFVHTGQELKIRRWEGGDWGAVHLWPGSIVHDVMFSIAPGDEQRFWARTERLVPGWYQAMKDFQAGSAGQAGGEPSTATVPFHVTSSMPIPQESRGTLSVQTQLDQTEVQEGTPLTLTVRNSGDVPLEHLGQPSLESFRDARSPRNGSGFGTVFWASRPPAILAPGEVVELVVHTHWQEPGNYRVVLELTQPLRGVPFDQRPKVTAATDVRITRTS